MDTFTPFSKEVQVLKTFVSKVNSILPKTNTLPAGLQITTKPHADNDKHIFSFCIENKDAESCAKKLILEIYKEIGMFSIKQVKTTEVTVDLLAFDKVNLKRSLETSGEKFGNYKPNFILKGWYDSKGVLHQMKDCQIHHLPKDAEKAVFALLTENDSEGAVAQNIISKSFLELI